MIPCFNAESFIAQTLDSVLAQTRMPDEVIVADDCSTDRSREIVASYPPPVRLVTQQRNSGCAASRNLAIRSSTGDTIALIDADDLWYPDHLAETASLLERFPGCRWAFSANDRFGTVRDTQYPAHPKLEPTDVLDQLLRGNDIHQLTVVFRRTLYDEAGGFDESMRYSEDYDLWLRFARRSCSVYTGKVTTAYRTHSGQLNQHLPQMFRTTWHARLKLLDEVRASDPARAAHLEPIIAETWRDGLYTAWAVRSSEALDFMLSMSDRFPDSASAARSWRIRRRIWPALLVADRVMGLLPARVRRVIRPNWGPGGNRPAKI